MPRRCWCSVVLLLGCLLPCLSRAQLLTDPAGLRDTYEAQIRWAEELASSRQEAALGLVTVAEEIQELPAGPGAEKMRLLDDAQELADRIVSLEEELVQARAMAGDTRELLVESLEDRVAYLLRNARDAPPAERRALEAEARDLEKEAEALRTRGRGEEAPSPDPLRSASGILANLARIVKEEHERLQDLQVLQDELRLFLANLRLFDETGLPPSARAGEGGGSGPGCPPSACPVGPSSPADLPLAHAQPGAPGDRAPGTSVTSASLARLYEAIRVRGGLGELEVLRLPEDGGGVSRNAELGTGLMAFRGDDESSSALGPGARGSLVFSWSLDEGLTLTMEPSLGGRGLRAGGSNVAEVAMEVREALTGSVLGGRSRWQLLSWQKGRFLSESLPTPGYLEPGRAEGGLTARLTVPLGSGWELEAEGGGDGVRYEPDDWAVLDRQGLSAALGAAWRGASPSARLSLRGGHYRFPRSRVGWQENREDTRLSMQLDGSLEGRWVARASLSGTWNSSRLEAYDFRSGRAAFSLSVPWGRGSLQAYGSLAHQVYLNPGPEDARVAPSDHDSGSIVSLQYALPLGTTRTLLVRGSWSRSETGFRNDFYERFGAGLQLGFRGQ